DAGLARGDGGAVALGVAGHAAHRHVDAEAGRSPVLLGLAPPEAVLTVLTRPAPARVDDLATHADRTSPGLPQEPGLGTLARGGEEQFGLTSAGCLARPRERAGEQQAGDGLGRHLVLQSRGNVVRQCGSGWPVGGTRPPLALRPPWLPIRFNLSNKQLRWKPSFLKMDQMC